jgi:hypothetical protein
MKGCIPVGNIFPNVFFAILHSSLASCSFTAATNKSLAAKLSTLPCHCIKLEIIFPFILFFHHTEKMLQMKDADFDEMCILYNVPMFCTMSFLRKMTYPVFD